MPDAGHESLRLSVVDALADALSNLELSDTFLELLNEAIADIADLKARVTALEP